MRIEHIKKKIILEPFKSRVPSLLPTITINGIEKDNSDGSWGEIPYPISLFNKIMKYGTIMELYYKLLRIIKNAEYKEYDASGGKWIDVEIDWRNLLFRYTDTIDTIIVTYDNTLKTVGSDKEIIGIVTYDDKLLFYDKIKEIFQEEYTGFDILNAMHDLIGIKVVPTKLDALYVPYLVYLTDVPDQISFMEELKRKKDNSCCDKKIYEDYGGDDFLTYLKVLPKAITSDIPRNPDNNELVMTTIDIPLLLVSDMQTFTQYKVYDDGEEDSDLSEEVNNLKKTNQIVTGISGESKLRTLRKRKKSYDDFGEEMPGICKPNQSKLDSHYEVGVIKNIQMFNNKYYGDTIVSMVEKDNATRIEITYVLGARLKTSGNSLILDETSPYDLNDASIEYGYWDGEGVWYRETYDYYKGLYWDGTVDGSHKTYTYDFIDFSASETIYTFEGIDFPRKNYILCNDIRYNPKTSSTAFPIFYDEKSAIADEPIRESYDVVIDRGSAAAFERHLMLGEVKTFNQLEILRNNYFNL